jgi:hypothetical protein
MKLYYYLDKRQQQGLFPATGLFQNRVTKDKTKTQTTESADTEQIIINDLETESEQQ